MKKSQAKAEKYALILAEIDRFKDVDYGQRLNIIAKKLAMTPQNLNYYLKRFTEMGLIIQVLRSRYTTYALTEKGRHVKEKLVQSEKGVKTVTWRYHNLIVGYKILNWGNFRFNKKKTVRMNNWSYQIVKADNGLQAHVQDTGLLKIYGPKIYGDDGEILRIKASTMVSEAARFFIDYYDFKLGQPKVLRKGQKELLNSEQLARLLGRIKTDEFFVDASGGDENLEEPDDSFAVENILSTLQETPQRLENLEGSMEKLAPTMDALARQNADLAKNIKLHLEVMNNINTGIRELRETLKTGVQTSRDQEELANLAAFCASKNEKSIKIEIMRDTGPFMGIYKGLAREYSSLPKGAIIYLEESTARSLISNGFAKEAI